MIPYDPTALQLLTEGTLALAQVEAAGVRIDADYLKKTIGKTERKIKLMEEELESDEVMKIWRQRFGRNTNLGSGPQLGEVLFDIMKLPSLGTTSKGTRYKTDDEALEDVDHPFCTKYLEIKKARNLIGTFMKGVLEETASDGRIHPFYNLNVARSYRSSCDSPNFQNLPIRDEKLAPLIRHAFIPSAGRQIVEIDLVGAEVRASACYNKDPKLTQYILDPTTDMHRDMAQELFLLPKKEVTKLLRQAAKSSFVFAEFYGDWYIDCAVRLWKSVKGEKTASGVDIYEHLQSRGISSLGDLNPKQKPEAGTFEAHVKKVEDNFWNKRFPVYTQWKKDWYAAYQEKGWFQTLTGFTCQGYMKRNQVINYPVQGSAFHCILWALTRLVLEELPRRKMKSQIVGQIHDSIVADVVREELDDFIALCRKVICVLLRKQWSWIIVPIEIEVEVAPSGAAWSEKRKYP